MMADQFDFDRIYGYLSPRDLSSFRKKDDSVQPVISDFVNETKKLTLLGNKYYSYDTIKKRLDSFYKDEKERELDLGFYAASTGSESSLGLKGTSSYSYWHTDRAGKESKYNFSGVQSLISSKIENKTLAVFSTVNPYCTPMTRGTENVEFFLNNIPTIFASQMVPYLDIEFLINRTAVKSGDTVNSNLSTPSALRFFLGSVSTLNLTDADKALDQASEPKINENFSRTVTGMEMFLMPQSLTNMDGLSSKSGSRLVEAKPFLPLASIEDFTVKILNMGARDIAKKSATLRLKVHDKNRLSEFAIFLRGNVGIAKASIVTTYGWVAPRGRGDNDAYAKFINENMMMRDTWIIANSSFSFNETGQATIAIELVTSGSKELMTANITERTEELTTAHRAFQESIETLEEIRRKIVGDGEGFAEIRQYQVLNEAIQNGSNVGDTDFSQSINELYMSLKSSALPTGKVTAADLKNLRVHLFSILGKGSKKDKNRTATHKEVLEKFATTAAYNRFNKLKQENSVDPFSTQFFNSSNKDLRYVGVIRDIYGQRNTKNTEGFILKNVSFGKVFLNFAAPALLSQNFCDELQVYFYPLNEECGPFSGRSVSEFPINVDRIIGEYRKMLASNVNVSVQAFFKMLVATHFNDKRSLGYDMTSAFENWNPEETGIKNKDNYDVVMLNWANKYGGTLNQPEIELLIETGYEEDSAGNASYLNSLKVTDQDRAPRLVGKKKIVRIHIFDKKANTSPEALNVVDAGNAYAIGKYKSPTYENFKFQSKSKKQQEIEAEKNQAINKLVKESPPLTIVSPKGFKNVRIPKGSSSALINFMASTVPVLRIGANGSLITNASLTSKTDGYLGAHNIVSQAKGYTGHSSALPPMSGLADPNNLPIRTYPAQLTMHSLGCPVAELYQRFFIDFQTGTSIDNLYLCSTITHSLKPGKFDTNWTFIFVNGYGKFSKPMTELGAKTGAIQDHLKLLEDVSTKTPATYTRDVTKQVKLSQYQKDKIKLETVEGVRKAVKSILGVGGSD